MLVLEGKLQNDSKRSAELNSTFLKGYWADTQGEKITRTSFSSTVRFYLERYYFYDAVLEIYLKSSTSKEEPISKDYMSRLIPSYFIKKQSYLEFKIKSKEEYGSLCDQAEVELCCRVDKGYGVYWEVDTVASIHIRKECFCKKQDNSLTDCCEQGCSIADEDYEAAARSMGVEVAVLKAIGKKESKGNSFYRQGQAVILFERHKMYANLRDKGYTKTQLMNLKEKYPRIVNPIYGGYGTYTEQYEKLETAKKIDYDAAIQSSSWGKFQVLGCYYSNSYSSTKELEEAMNMCEKQQFNYFIAYLKGSTYLINAIKNKDWERIAQFYNGANWKVQNPTYASDIRTFYHEFKNKENE